MNSYHVLPLKIETDFIWCVMENQTDQLIQAFEFKDDAKKYAKFLERGGAFSGWTSSFMLQEVVVHEDINREFNSFLTE